MIGNAYCELRMATPSAVASDHFANSHNMCWNPRRPGLPYWGASGASQPARVLMMCDCSGLSQSNQL